MMFICSSSLGNISSANSQVKNLPSIFNQKINSAQNINNQSTSSYIYGLQMGQRFTLQYHLLTNYFLLRVKKDIKTKIFHEINEYKKNIEIYYPEYLEEFKGLSKSTNINLDTLLSIQLFLVSYNRSECTSTVSTGNATKNNKTYLTMDLDINVSDPMLFVLRLFFTHYVLEHNARSSRGRYNYMFLGVPIIYEIFLINEKGLCFAGNGLGLATNRTIDTGPGMSTFLLERKTMATCANVNEVAQLWKNTNRSSYDTEKWPYFWDFSMSVWCDKNGGILMIEQTHSYIITVFGNSTNITGGPANILWHSNHHQWLDPNLTGSKFAWEYPTSARRAQRAYELLVNNYGNITLDTCKKIITDHGGGTDPNGPDSSDICRVPDSNWTRITAFAWISDPKECTVYITLGQPCKTRLIKHNFSKRLDDNPPFTIVDIDGKYGTNGWYTSDVIIQIHSNDDLSGIKNSYYKINNQRWKSYRNSMVVTQDNTYDIKYKSVDRAGNHEPIKKTGFKIDQTSPTIRLRKYMIGGNLIKFSAIVQDTVSKINRVEFYKDDTLQTTIYSDPYIWYCVSTTNHTIKAVVYDNAGNSASDSKNISFVY